MTARDELIRAAERLFAAQGIEGVSLREITRQAGQRNVTALQYHFIDREGLLVAVVERHVRPMSARTHELLDGLGSPTGARPVVECVVGPLCERAESPEGRDFLQIAAQLLNRAVSRPPAARDPARLLVDDEAQSLRRWAETLAGFMHPAAIGPPLHQRFAVLRFAYTELARRVRESGQPPSELFRAHLNDLLAALATAPPSPETLSTLTSRSRTGQ